ncbi:MULTISPECIES: NepR family anti-sigma factor [unclassified Meridianimarinicoccus]|uniref:NepR family anti-sigma factor n=1 Tax=unclassified Meridianimarinicoccus TaxID=2923344 RepID=UPI0018661190|nr:NepR family anti-sigma factor [Fluviibacterium sp. MJW13]
MAKIRKADSLDKQIDDNLRRVYSDAVNEPLPDRFAQLLQQLRDAEAGRDTAEKNGEDTK